MEPTVTAMDALITNVGKVVTAGMDWLGDAVTAVTSSGNELLLLFKAEQQTRDRENQNLSYNSTHKSDAGTYEADTTKQQ